MERENLAGDVKGKGTSGSNREAESTDAPERGGLPRSSSHRLCRPTANETLLSHCRVVGIELRQRVCFFVVLKRGNARGAKGGGSSPLRSGQPATGVAVRLTAPAYARGRRTVSIRTFRRRIGGSCRVHKSDSKIDSASSVSSAA